MATATVHPRLFEISITLTFTFRESWILPPFTRVALNFSPF